LYQTVILQKKEEYMSIYEYILYIITYVYICLCMFIYIYMYSYINNFFPGFFISDSKLIKRKTILRKKLFLILLNKLFKKLLENYLKMS